MHRVFRSIVPLLFALTLALPAAAAVLQIDSASLIIEPAQVPRLAPFPVAPTQTLVGVSGATAQGTLAVGGSVSLPSALFATSVSTAVGLTPNSMPNTVYLISQTVGAASASGTLSPGAAPGGGFGGFLNAGLSAFSRLSIVPFTFTFASVFVPLSPIGNGGTTSVMAGILTNAFTITVTGTGWTTGMVAVSDPGGPISDPPTAFTRTGTDRITVGGRREITLVTPFAMTINGVGGVINNVGIATLSLLLAPEPGVLALLGVAGAALLAGAARRT